MDWPPQSPDINIIEEAWDHLAKIKEQKAANAKEGFWNDLQEAWRTIFEDVLKKLQHSHRVQALLKSKGCYTKY